MGNDNLNAIAVIGMSCRFPKSDDVRQYWKNIQYGRECMETLTAEDLEQAGVASSLFQRDDYVRRCSSISDIDKFDADFFKISPREAEYMDPQQRIMLEKAWEAVEDAGYELHKLGEKVAVFASTSASSYFLENLLNNPNFLEDAGGMKAVLHGLDKDHIATKIAYKLNLTGPAVTIQCACSSSMVSVIMACQSLLTYQCDAALAGGVTINVPQHIGYLYEKGSVMSPDGYCRPFDEDAGGTVFGSGVGCIVLKRLEDAMEDHDRIYSVIRGFSVSNDGNDKVGYTAPGIKGQMEVISEALEFSQIDPSTISYVEAHGTATIMGDPIEVEAISKVYEKYTHKKQYCAIGSVKANIGHLNVASGIAGIIKAALAIENRVIPPSINVNQENSKINFKDTPFYINRQCKVYDGTTPMRAAVSSFGIGGTNGHIIMEEFLTEYGESKSKSQYIIPISARDNEDLRQACANLCHHLTNLPSVHLADIERTLQCGRKGLKTRKAFIVRDLHELLQKLEKYQDDNLGTGRTNEIPLKAVFPCSASYDMEEVKKMYKDISLFKKHFERVREIFEEKCSVDLSGLLSDTDMTGERQYLFRMIVGMAVVKSWKELGLKTEVLFCSGEKKLAENLPLDMVQIKEAVEEYLGISEFKKDSDDLEGFSGLADKNIYDRFTTAVSGWWENCGEVHWDQWVNEKTQNKISLPAYPFKKNSYWSCGFKSKLSPKTHLKKEPVEVLENQYERPELCTLYVMPENELHERLIDAWGRLLGVKGIGIEDDFFELGGHSLMASQLIAEIRDEFLVELEIEELFSCPTISRLSLMIAEKLSDLIEQMEDQEIDAYLKTENTYEL
ncbi:MAG: phosphopantetheine-binding protein [Hungatella sp.]|jgi:acyl transferase domain-containing protein/acyl carrier protein|nr:phosphopantetheine-binding protein [Hungatella sp.]